MSPRKVTIWQGVLAAVFALPALATADETSRCPLTNKEIAEVLITGKLAYTRIDVPPSQYKSDGNPDTLEIVILPEGDDASSKVSEDGEVIFVSKKTLTQEKKQMQELYMQAAYRKAVLKKNLTKLCSGPWTHP